MNELVESLIKENEELREQMAKIKQQNIQSRNFTINEMSEELTRKKYIDVACADGLLRIKTLQLAGKKRLNADELLRGFTIDERFRFI